MSATTARGADAIRSGRTSLGIEFGSTRIKACLVDADDPAHVLAVGGFVAAAIRSREKPPTPVVALAVVPVSTARMATKPIIDMFPTN